MKNSNFKGHVLAAVTIFIWGTTFVSTKILLNTFSPCEILFFRFFLAFGILLLFFPSGMKFESLKNEIIFAALGLSGISLYFWTENLALKYTYASNVGLILSSIPILTALMAHIFTNDEKFTLKLTIGFLVAMAGISLIVLNGRVLRLDPIGDALALLSAVCFSVYSVLLKRTSSGSSQVRTTTKIFFYGLVFSFPVYLLSGSRLVIPGMFTLVNVVNMLFLSVLASILCFTMWNRAVSILGPVRTSNYIYLVPLITMVSSIVVLGEKVNALMVAGGILILLGVKINEGGIFNVKALFRVRTIFLRSRVMSRLRDMH